MIQLLLLQAFALRGGTVHTMLPGEEPRVATVVVRDGRVAAVGADLELEDDVELVDATGQHVVPGLIDGMVNHDLEHDALYTLAGVTLVRDVGNDLGRVFEAREPRVRDATPGPALFLCGAVLDGVPPATTEAVVVTTPEEVDDKLPRLQELGVDYVAFHLGIPPAAWRRAIEVAHEAGLAVWGPVPRAATLDDVLAAGQDGLFYLDGLVPRGVGWAGLELDDLDAAAARVAAAGLAVTPLLDVYAKQLHDPGDEAPELALLAPHYEALWRRELAARRPLLGADARAAAEHALLAQERAVARMHAAGVPLMPGSAAPNPWHLPGAGLHDELAQWVAAGVPPAAVLRAATRGAAEVLGVAAERGAIAPGMVADLVCCAADPRVDLSTLRAPERVVVRGRRLERADLDGLRAALLDGQARARASSGAPLEVALPELPDGELLLGGTLEAIAIDQRVALERWAVVALPDGGRAYVARLVSPAPAGQPASETRVVQRIVDGRLESFELEILRAGQTLRIAGLSVGGQFRIERRLQGAHLDTNAIDGRPALLDTGTGSTAVVLGAERRPGPCSVLYFEDVTPAVGRWELVVEDNGDHLVRSSAAPWAAQYDSRGAPTRVERVQGAGAILYRPLAGAPVEGPGLELASRAGEGGR